MKHAYAAKPGALPPYSNWQHCFFTGSARIQPNARMSQCRHACGGGDDWCFPLTAEGQPTAKIIIEQVPQQTNIAEIKLGGFKDR